MLLTDRQRLSGAGSANNVVVADADEILRRIYTVLRRDAKLIGIIFALILAVTAAVVFIIPPSYTATTTILIDPRASGVFSNQIQFQIGPSDPAIIDSQVEILRSDHIAQMVAEKLELKNDPELLGEEGVVNTVLYYATWLFSGGAPTDYEKLQAVLRTFQKRIDVQRNQQTFLIDVQFRSYSSEKAARIANAIAEAYFIDQLQAQFDQTKLANVWLKDRIKELRDAAVAADARVETYKAENKIIGTGTAQLLNEKEMSDVSSQLVQARADTAQAEARYVRMRAVVDSADVEASVTTEVLNNPLIQKLRNDYGDLSKKESDLAQRFSPAHQALTQVRQQITEVRRLILEEYSRIADTTKNDLEIARAREKSISDQLNRVTSLTSSTNASLVQLRELMRDSVSSRTVYENYLQRFTDLTQQQSLPVTQTRVVNTALQPLIPSHPKKLLILALAAGGALAIGIGTALLRDRFDSTLRTSEDLEEIIQARCLGVVPLLGSDLPPVRKGTRLPARQALQRKMQETHRTLQLTLDRLVTLVSGNADDQGAQSSPDNLSFVVRTPFSHFAETMRSIKLAAQAASVEARIIAITSALPQEGKTTTAANLAHHLASTKHTVLLVDADLRNRSLSRQLAPNVKLGLLEVLSKNTPLKNAQRGSSASTLKFLPVVLPKDGLPNTGEVLGSDGFKQFLQDALKSFDFVVIDSPPVLPVVDVRAMNGAVDSFVFVAEWGRSTRKAVEKAIITTDAFQGKLLGGILNKVDAGQMVYYSGYYDVGYHGIADDPKVREPA